MADSILRLRLESSEYDNKIKRAVSGLMQMESECRKVGGTLAVLEKDQLDYVKSLGNMETVSRTARGRISELSNAYVELAVQYRRLTDEEKKGDYGKALNSSLAQLKGRLNDAKKELAEVESEMKGASAAGVDFNSVLASLGQRFGINSELMGVLTSGTLATTAAVTAGAAAVAAATKMWADYNDELNRQTNVTTVTTGLKGDDAENLTIGVRALARTYDVDFREAINAANTLIQQFGVSGEQALSLLQDGMQGMIAGDGGKLLSMIQQYAPAFRDAGISASQLVAVIQNSEGGLFTDQNMQAIVMGIRNIRLMTKQTSDALAQLGIDGQEMSRKLEDGSMTIFDALRQVSGAIDNVDSGSKAAGEVMQSVFGRQGTMAGTKLGEAIATLNTNLEETKSQTGELGESFVRLNEANMRLERTMQEIFGMTGWEDMSNTIKTQFAESISDALQYLIDVRDALNNIGSYDSFETLADAARRFVPALWPVLKGLQEMKGLLNDIESAWNGITGNTPEPPKAQPQTTKQKPVQNGYQVTTDKNGKVVSTKRIVNGEKKDDTENYKKAHQIKPTVTPPTTFTPTTTKPKTTPKITTKKEEILPDGSVAALEKQLSDLQKAQKLATDTRGWKDYDAQINVVKENIAALKGELPKDKVATFRIDALTDDARKALESIQCVHIEEKKVEVTADTQQAEKAIQAIPTKKDVQVDVVPGDVTLPNIPTDDKTIKVNVEEGDVSLQNIPTDETVEVTVIADTQEAYDQIKALYPDAPIELKVKVKADTTDLTKLTNTNISGKISELQKQVNTSEWGSEDYSKAKTSLADANAFRNVFEKAVQTGIDTADIDQSALWDKIVGGVDIDDAVWEDLVNRINENLAEAAINPIKLDFDTGNLTSQKSKKNNEKDDFSKLSDNFSKLNGGVNQIVSGVQQIGVDVPAEIGEMLTVLQGLSTILTGILAVTTLINTKQDVQIATSIIPFARGGIIPHAATGFVVPGNDFSDRTPVLASSGEIILNKAQQGNLASQLTGAALSTQGSTTPYVDGEKIFLGVNNFLKRSGRGEIVTSR